jgi:Fe(3+) dicitrate transport protein|tara:strand:- start:1136 stop:3559 length:2424 start_codon:yes stop_codon:yes gene_type:complete
MKLKAYKILFFIMCSSHILNAQNRVFGTVTVEDNELTSNNIFIYDDNTKLLTTTDSKGNYEFFTEKNQMKIIFLLVGSQYEEQDIIIQEQTELNIIFKKNTKVLSEVIIKGRKIKEFELKRLKDVEGTAIYAGKKTEVILVDQSMANLASNNARQIYNQISGLNIYQNDDAGLQLHIGGRGLDPNRTSNFNTRQNGYDISADVLGYPESYYTPPAESLSEIQIIRGAASLQYGTQFGGLINFKIKEPAYKKIEFVSRNTIGSNNLFTNFSSLSGRNKKYSYYTYYNHKTGDGFRENSEYDSDNFYFHLGKQINNTTKISGELSYLTYLAKQAGGLSDYMFESNPLQSNRSRNWFNLDWLLYNFKLEKSFNTQSSLLLSFFGLNASRKTIGFRSNRVDQVDPMNERDLITGDFKNFGLEVKFLKNYSLFKKKSVMVFGGKYYRSKTSSNQGPGSEKVNADFKFYLNSFPNYPNQSNYTYPNKNLALFGENIFYFNDNISITPGFRIENIETKSIGSYKQINVDAAGNVIYEKTFLENRTNNRTFILFGLGTSYKLKNKLEIYSNISENYRSVTFADMSIINPAFLINPNIKDESGTTIDLGFRGIINDVISFDLTAFQMFYNNRIGFIQREFNDGSVKSERGNIGNANIYGLESNIDIDLNKLILKNDNSSLNYFINTALINSKYIKSKENGVIGKKVEFVPNVNLKTGIKYGFENLIFNVQYSYISKQFTDSSNSIKGNISGIIGEIPNYSLTDISLSYLLKKIRLEYGINNITNTFYFTRRATGYPGPGIIPSPPRNMYLTLQIKI